MLMLLAVLVAVAGWYFHRVGDQRKAVEWLYGVDGLGRRVCYDYEIISQDGSEVSLRDRKPVVPSWLINCLGIDCFCTVVRANVDLGNSPSIKPIGLLTNLTSLRIEGAAISDFGPLGSLINLEDLHLYRTNVRDLTPLSELHKLETLWIEGTSVSDLTPLKNLARLRCLSAENTKIADLTPLANAKELLILDIQGTRVTSLAPIADLRGLRSVNIENTSISDISPLLKLEDLKHVYLGNTKVPGTQVDQLASEFPECEILTD